jgi:integrase
MTHEGTRASGGRARRRPVVYSSRRVTGLYERKTSDGRLVFELRRKVGGRSVRHTLAATTATDAIREQRAFLAKLDAGAQLVGRNDLSLRELRDLWEGWACSPGSPYAARTVEHNLSALDRRVLRILGAETKAVNVRPAHLRAMIDKLCGEGLSGATVHGTLTALSALFRFAVRRDVLEMNPVRMLERGDRPSAKRRREPRYLDRLQLDALLFELGDGFRPVAAVMAFAALRVSEALALRWHDVDFEQAMLNVPGTKTAASAQPVPMTGDLVTELRAHRNRNPGVGDALVFSTVNGRPQDRHNVARAIRAAGDAAGLNPQGVKKVAPHDLRHSCAALLLAAGIPAPKVAAVLRHADARVTLMVYAGLVESQRSELRTDLEAALGTNR